MIRAVAFDLGGVLVDVDHARAARALDVAEEQYQRAFFGGDAHDRLSRGALGDTEFVATIAERLARPAERVRSGWAEVVRAWPGARALVDAVAARGVRVLIWSNTDPIHADAIARDLPHVRGARGLSFVVGAMKPEPAFYQAALEPDLAFHEVLFLDDRAENVAAARALGVNAEQVVGGLSDTHRLISRAWP